MPLQKEGRDPLVEEVDMAPTAFMDPDYAPTESEIAEALGPSALLWEQLTAFVREAYGIEPTRRTSPRARTTAGT